MTAVQINAMNAEVWRNIGAIADNEALMCRLARYTRKLVKEQKDPGGRHPAVFPLSLLWRV